ncbi:hypothetical protein SAMN05216584_1332 [Selenomonas sp. WCT3]|uniref:hypothetical protein n=1 Tax=Selenomonas sp. WCT3 TaxID=3158785 RepID=UPI0008809BBA|nr:hypothetical protein SAMN05216584_11110 [Selenomonas ruminantium]SDH05910.1 hypothetical protein SAMN05216584_1332 [Selenomonas ruminantium]
MQRAKKIVVYLMVLWLLCFLYSAVMNYWENGNDFKRDPKVLYEIYGELPIPDNTNEIEKKESIRERYSVSLDIYYCTRLSKEQIKRFYIMYLTDKGWKQIDKQDGNCMVLFKKDKWKIAVQDENEKYRVNIYKIYRY